MPVSNMNGEGKKGYQKLNPTILNAMRGTYMQYSRKLLINVPIE